MLTSSMVSVHHDNGGQEQGLACRNDDRLPLNDAHGSMCRSRLAAASDCENAGRLPSNLHDELHKSEQGLSRSTCSFIETA